MKRANDSHKLKKIDDLMFANLTFI